MNITLQIILNAPAHDLSYDPAKEARRLARGDLIAIFDADVVAPYNGSEHILRDIITGDRFCFIHVQNIPDRPISQLREKLLAADVSVGVDDDGKPLITAYHRRKKWGAIVSNIPAAIRNRLISDKQITITWTQAKNYIENVRSGAKLTDQDVV